MVVVIQDSMKQNLQTRAHLKYSAQYTLFQIFSVAIWYLENTLDQKYLLIYVKYISQYFVPIISNARFNL